MFSIAVIPHSPGVMYYHLLLRRETRIPMRVNLYMLRFCIGKTKLSMKRYEMLVYCSKINSHLMSRSKCTFVSCDYSDVNFEILMTRIPSHSGIPYTFPYQKRFFIAIISRTYNVKYQTLPSKFFYITFCRLS